MQVQSDPVDFLVPVDSHRAIGVPVPNGGRRGGAPMIPPLTGRAKRDPSHVNPGPLDLLGKPAVHAKIAGLHPVWLALCVWCVCSANQTHPIMNHPIHYTRIDTL